jgi:hypothetical protein
MRAPKIPKSYPGWPNHEAQGSGRLHSSDGALHIVLLLVIGIGFLGQREGQYRAAQQQIYYIQAKALADAGLQDALGKLSKDIDFPPVRSNDQSVFGYQEIMRDTGGDRVGSFRVSVDVKYREPRYRVLRIRSLGILGAEDDPRARVERLVEIDMATTVRGSDAPNPNLFKVHFTKTNSL